MKQRTQLDKVPVDAVEKMIDQLPIQRRVEVVPIEEALGRVVVESYYSQVSFPMVEVSAMDGVAVDWQETLEASFERPLTLYVNRNAWLVDTGEPLPSGTDVVIRIEDVEWLAESELQIVKSVTAGQFVRKVGEDLLEGQLVVPAFRRLTPTDIGGLAAGSIAQVKVLVSPVVRVIATGSELVEPGMELKLGQLIDSNSRMIAAFVQEWGGQAVRQMGLPDDRKLLGQGLSEALAESDLVVMIAGSSKGREDYTAQVIGELGQVLVHGMAIKPGQPVIVGEALEKAVIGLPGYPVAAVGNAQLLVRRWLENYYGQSHERRMRVQAVVKREIRSPKGSDELIRVRVGQVGEELVAIPLSRKYGVVTSLVRANGILRLPAGVGEILAGSEVEVELLEPLGELTKQVMILGTYHPAMDQLVEESVRGSAEVEEIFFGTVRSDEEAFQALDRGEVAVIGVGLAPEKIDGELNRANEGHEFKYVELGDRGHWLVCKNTVADGWLAWVRENVYKNALI